MGMRKKAKELVKDKEACHGGTALGAWACAECPVRLCMGDPQPRAKAWLAEHPRKPVDTSEAICIDLDDASKGRTREENVKIALEAAQEAGVKWIDGDKANKFTPDFKFLRFGGDFTGRLWHYFSSGDARLVSLRHWRRVMRQIGREKEKPKEAYKTPECTRPELDCEAKIGTGGRCMNAFQCPPADDLPQEAAPLPESVDPSKWIGKMVAAWSNDCACVTLAILKEYQPRTIDSVRRYVNGAPADHIALVMGHTERLALPPSEWTDRGEML